MQPQNPPQPVLTITDLDVAILESFPLQFRISARGTVPTVGWSAPELVPFTYVQAPPDGIYDFDFVASPPSHRTAQVITPIRVIVTITDPGAKGFRVHAAQNFKEVVFFPHNPTTASRAES
jgi:hypothetical protein